MAKKPIKLTVLQSKMLKALEATYSNVTDSTKEVGISRGTHYQWMDKNAHYKKEVEDLNEGLLDRAENINSDPVLVQCIELLVIVYIEEYPHFSIMSQSKT